MHCIVCHLQDADTTVIVKGDIASHCLTLTRSVLLAFSLRLKTDRERWNSSIFLLDPPVDMDVLN